MCILLFFLFSIGHFVQQEGEKATQFEQELCGWLHWNGGSPSATHICGKAGEDRICWYCAEIWQEIQGSYVLTFILWFTLKNFYLLTCWYNIKALSFHAPYMCIILLRKLIFLDTDCKERPSVNWKKDLLDWSRNCESVFIPVLL